MVISVIGYFGVISVFMTTNAQAGVLTTDSTTELSTEISTDSTIETTTPIALSAPDPDNTWYVVPAIVWASVATVILLTIVIVILCVLLRRRFAWFAGLRHRRLDSERDDEAVGIRRIFEPTLFTALKPKTKQKSRKTHSHKKKSTDDNTDKRTSRTDTALTGPDLRVVHDAGSYRSETENNLFSISRLNPVYECDGEDNILIKSVFKDNRKTDGMDVYIPDDQSSAPSVRRSSAASITLLPYPSMTAAGPPNPNVHGVPHTEADTNAKSFHTLVDNRKDTKTTSKEEKKRKDPYEDVGCFEERPLCCVP